MRIRNSTALVLGALALTPLACSNQSTVDIGGNAGSKLSDYAASWDGYAEAFQFESGSDRIRIGLDANGQGTLEVGDGPMLPPPDPDVRWPPGAETLDGALDGQTALKAGFRYPVQQARVEANRIQLTVTPAELYRPWCQAQTPILNETRPTEPTYLCVPSWEVMSDPSLTQCTLTNPDTGEQVEADCVKLLLCRNTFYRVCTCTATSCDLSPTSSATADLSSAPFPTNQLDAALENAGTEMTGTLLLTDVGASRLTVRLTRQ